MAKQHITAHSNIVFNQVTLTVGFDEYPLTPGEASMLANQLQFASTEVLISEAIDKHIDQ